MVYNSKDIRSTMPVEELVYVKNFQKFSLLKRFNQKLGLLYSDPFENLNYPTQDTVWLQSKENRNLRLKRHVQFI